MKRKASVVLIAVVTLLAVLSPAGLAAAVRLAEPDAPQAGAPTVVSYQGQVVVSGAAYSGTGYFKFAIVDGKPNTHWSNDGTSAGGGEPTNAVPLTVANGLFNVLLGDTTLTNMTTLPASAFGGTARYLRVWFNRDNFTTFIQLAPDRRIAAAPFALQAEEAANAATLDGHNPGNASGNVPLNNGTVNTDLNADLLDGQHAVAFAASHHSHDHGGLTDLENDDHPQYFNLSQDETVSGRPAFNGGSTFVSPPFSVDSTYLVDNLNADRLDGQHAADFAASSHSHDHGGLTGLSDDGHPQYFNLSQHETVSGRPAFNGGTSGSSAPFSVDSDTRVANLNADLLDGQHGSSYQARVSGTCGVGSTIRGINADGTVTCQNDAPLNRVAAPADNTRTAVDDAGRHTSITIGADGLGLISYFDLTNDDLKVAHCNDAACSSASTFTLDSSGWVGEYTSITIGTDGLGLISYFEVDTADLKVAHCNDAACSSATTYTLDSDGWVGEYTSITIGTDGLGLISYYDRTHGALKVAHCNDVACSSASTFTLDSGSYVGEYTSIALGADGLGLISYHASNGGLKVAHCNDVACASAAVYTLGGVGEYTSITIGADGLGLISYFDSNNYALWVAHCADAACTDASLTRVDGAEARYTSITIGADGLGLISYSGTSYELKVAHCADAACSSVSTFTLDSSGYVGLGTSVTIGADGLGLISYHDATNGDLKVAQCANAFCTPYFRRR